MPELHWFTWGQPGSPTETGNINRILLHIRGSSLHVYMSLC